MGKWELNRVLRRIPEFGSLHKIGCINTVISLLAFRLWHSLQSISNGWTFLNLSCNKSFHVGMTLYSTMQRKLGAGLLLDVPSVASIGIYLRPVLISCLGKVKAKLVIVLHRRFILTARWFILKVFRTHWAIDWMFICILIYRISARRTLFANPKRSIDLSLPICITT